MENVIKKILREQKISDLQDTITIDYELWKDTRHDSYHINKRKRQGGYNREGIGRITDYDIKTLIEKGLNLISEYIVDGEIKHKRRFVLSEKGGNFLNIVIEPQNIDGTWQLIVITVMRKRDFKPNYNTKPQISV